MRIQTWPCQTKACLLSGLVVFDLWEALEELALSLLVSNGIILKHTSKAEMLMDSSEAHPMSAASCYTIGGYLDYCSPDRLHATHSALAAYLYTGCIGEALVHLLWLQALPAGCASVWCLLNVYEAGGHHVKTS